MARGRALRARDVAGDAREAGYSSSNDGGGGGGGTPSAVGAGASGQDDKYFGATEGARGVNPVMERALTEIREYRAKIGAWRDPLQLILNLGVNAKRQAPGGG